MNRATVCLLLLIPLGVAQTPPSSPPSSVRQVPSAAGQETPPPPELNDFGEEKATAQELEKDWHDIESRNMAEIASLGNPCDPRIGKRINDIRHAYLRYAAAWRIYNERWGNQVKRVIADSNAVEARIQVVQERKKELEAELEGVRDDVADLKKRGSDSSEAEALLASVKDAIASADAPLASLEAERHSRDETIDMVNGRLKMLDIEKERRTALYDIEVREYAGRCREINHP
jgi:chromosome segregation ATPase